MKEILREEEKKHYKTMAKMSKSKTPERTRKEVHDDFVKKEKPALIAKSQERVPSEQAAKISISRARIEKKASETNEDFATRKEFYSLTNKKVPKNAYKQHKISKK
jgi:hypothetical protein